MRCGIEMTGRDETVLGGAAGPSALPRAFTEGVAIPKGVE